LYYEIWETNHTCNCCLHALLLMWQKSEGNNNNLRLYSRKCHHFLLVHLVHITRLWVTYTRYSFCCKMLFCKIQCASPHLGDIVLYIYIYGRIILKWILNGISYGLDSSDSEYSSSFVYFLIR
jgi:hypothetical protein